MVEAMRQCVNMGPCALPACGGRCARCIRHEAEQRNLAKYRSIDYPGSPDRIRL